MKKADVSHEKDQAVVTYDTWKVTVEQMIAAVKKLGYTRLSSGVDGRNRRR